MIHLTVQYIMMNLPNVVMPEATATESPAMGRSICKDEEMLPCHWSVASWMLHCKAVEAGKLDRD